MTETYHGKPCKVCGGTERRKGNRGCVRSGDTEHLDARGYLKRKRELERNHYATDPEFAERRREYKRNYNRVLRAEGRHWNQQPENRERLDEHRRRYQGTVKGIRTRMRFNHKRRLARNELEKEHGPRPS